VNAGRDAVQDGDTFVTFNYRSDRMREFAEALGAPLSLLFTRSQLLPSRVARGTERRQRCN
jgi:bisphosphoglycerate-independent phosphoglycerate mutase (AlkP superfamily)